MQKDIDPSFRVFSPMIMEAPNKGGGGGGVAGAKSMITGAGISGGVSRQTFLRLSGLAAAGLGLAACAEAEKNPADEMTENQSKSIKLAAAMSLSALGINNDPLLQTLTRHLQQRFVESVKSQTGMVHVETPGLEGNWFPVNYTDPEKTAIKFVGKQDTWLLMREDGGYFLRVTDANPNSKIDLENSALLQKIHFTQLRETVTADVNFQTLTPEQQTADLEYLDELIEGSTTIPNISLNGVNGLYGVKTKSLGPNMSYINEAYAFGDLSEEQMYMVYDAMQKTLLNFYEGTDHLFTDLQPANVGLMRLPSGLLYPVLIDLETRGIVHVVDPLREIQMLLTKFYYQQGMYVYRYPKWNAWISEPERKGVNLLLNLPDPYLPTVTPVEPDGFVTVSIPGKNGELVDLRISVKNAIARGIEIPEGMQAFELNPVVITVGSNPSTPMEFYLGFKDSAGKFIGQVLNISGEIMPYFVGFMLVNESIPANNDSLNLNRALAEDPKYIWNDDNTACVVVGKDGNISFEYSTPNKSDDGKIIQAVAVSPPFLFDGLGKFLNARVNALRSDPIALKDPSWKEEYDNTDDALALKLSLRDFNDYRNLVLDYLQEHGDNGWHRIVMPDGYATNLFVRLGAGYEMSNTFPKYEVGRSPGDITIVEAPLDGAGGMLPENAQMVLELVGDFDNPQDLRVFSNPSYQAMSAPNTFQRIMGANGRMINVFYDQEKGMIRFEYASE